MRRLLIIALAWLLAAPALAQVPYFPQTLPGNSVVGNSLATPAPTQAIPFTTLSKQLSAGPFSLVPLSGATSGTINLSAPSTTSNWTLTLPPNPGTLGYFLGTDGLGNATWQGFVPSGSGAVTRTWQSKAGDSTSVLDYGAKGDGVTDDTTAIQTAINACPAQGCTIIFPALAYKISSTLTIGNGSSSAVSIKQGVLLQGLGVPVTSAFAGYPATAGPKLVWAGGTNTDFIHVLGPLQGWGIQNLTLDGGSTQGLNGIHVTSGMFGDTRNLVCNKVWRCIASDSVPHFGSVTFTDSFHNSWQNILINLPDLTGPVVGIYLTGDGLGTPQSNTDYNQFSNVTFLANAISNVSYAIYLQVCDSINFNGVHIFGGFPNLTPVNFDYSVANSFPNSNTFHALDFDGSSPITVGGTPNVSITPNYIFGLQEGNGSVQPVGLKNVNFTPSIPSLGSIRLTGQTAAIGATTLFNLGNFPQAMWKINYYLEVTTAGTGGTMQVNFGWQDIFQAETFSSGTVSIPSRGFTSGTAIIRTAGVSDPTYSTQFNSVTGSPQYALFIKAEKLD